MPANAALIEKLNTLLEGRLGEVEDFVDFIRKRGQDRDLGGAAPAFATAWDDPYDGI